MVPANHSLVARKHNAVQPQRRKGGAADAAEKKSRLAGPSIPAVAVEGRRGVVQRRDQEGRVGVGRDGVGGSWRKCKQRQSRLREQGQDVLSSEDVKGTAPERTTTTRPRARRAKPRERAKYVSRAGVAQQSVSRTALQRGQGGHTAWRLVAGSEDRADEGRPEDQRDGLAAEPDQVAETVCGCGGLRSGQSESWYSD